MSAHELSFPYEVARNRDLSDADLWQRSLRRSVHRREITEAARKHAMRRKSAAVAVTASMAAGPVAAPFAAVASVGSGSAVSTKTAGGGAGGSAISLPSGALVDYGDTGEAVAAVQKVVGVDNDGIFGPITQGGVKRWQQANGLPATGAVDAKTWTKMFQSSVSYVGKDGKTTVTVNDKTSTPRGSTGGVDGPAPTTTKPRTKQKPSSKRSDVAEKNRNAITKPQSVTDQTVQAPAEETAPAPAQTGGGCGAGKIASPVSGTTTGVYGENRGSHAHAGKDIAAPTGTAVRAAQCGTVTKAGMDGSGYGNLVCIEHEGGVSTCYAHLSQINTKVGTYVHVGDVIGKVGCTGSCTGPHLHFEVRENGKTVNPDSYLTGAKTIAGAAPKTGKLAAESTGTAAAWGEATPASSAETEATLAAAYNAAADATATAAVAPAAATGEVAPATTDAAAVAGEVAPAVTVPGATGEVAPATDAAATPANGASTDGSAGQAAPATTDAATAPAEATAPATTDAPAAPAEATAPATTDAPAAPAEATAPATTDAPAAPAEATAPAETAPAATPASEAAAPAPAEPAPAETAPAPVAETAPAAETPAPAPAETAPVAEAPAPAAETSAPAPAEAAPAAEAPAPAPAAEAPAETAPAPAAESTPAPVAETPAAPADAAPAEETGAAVAPVG